MVPFVKNDQKNQVYKINLIRRYLEQTRVEDVEAMESDP